MRAMKFLLGMTLLLGVVRDASAAAVLTSATNPGFYSNTLAANDDLSTGLEAIGFTVNFFGISFTNLYVNNNGNITFDAALSTFTPFDLTSTGQQIIAPFFADVDTTSAGLEVTYGADTVGGRLAFGVNWIDVDYFLSDQSHRNRNSFQLVLIDRSDIAAGDFDIMFNYDQIQWETGEASGSDAEGLGGDSARAGFSNGTGAPGSFFELAGSAVNGAFLDSNLASGLIHNQLNSNLDGRYIFEARNGRIDPGQPVVPEPTSMALAGFAGIGMAVGAWRRRRLEKQSAA